MDHTAIQHAITEVLPLPDEDLSILSQCMEQRILDKGDAVLKEGERCRAFYFVQEGYVRTYYNKDGEDINLQFTLEGSFTTNVRSIKSKQPSEVTIAAGEPSVVWSFNLDKLPKDAAMRPYISKFVRRLTIHSRIRSKR